MPGDFEEVASKFRWAGHQLAAVDLAISDYVALNPYVAVVKDQPGAQAYQVVAHLRYPPPASISHVIGDALNSLHGTLDYLAWQLAIREDGDPPDLRTAFPIIKGTQEDGSEPAVNIYRSGKGGRGTVPLISDSEVIKRLRDVQPYHLAPDERHLHPLLLLRTLNGESKHRHPAVVVSAIDHGHYFHPAGNVEGLGTRVAVVTTNFTPRKDGDELATVPYALAQHGAPPEHDKFTTFIAFEESPVFPRTGEPMPAQVALADIATYIATNVLDVFAELF